MVRDDVPAGQADQTRLSTPSANAPTLGSPLRRHRPASTTLPQGAFPSRNVTAAPSTEAGIRSWRTRSGRLPESPLHHLSLKAGESTQRVTVAVIASSGIRQLTFAGRRSREWSGRPARVGRPESTAARPATQWRLVADETRYGKRSRSGPCWRGDPGSHGPLESRWGGEPGRGEPGGSGTARQRRPHLRTAWRRENRSAREAAGIHRRAMDVPTRLPGPDWTGVPLP